MRPRFFDGFMSNAIQPLLTGVFWIKNVLSTNLELMESRLVPDCGGVRRECT